MPCDVVTHVSNLGHAQGMPKSLTFADCYGFEILDDANDSIMTTIWTMIPWMMTCLIPWTPLVLILTMTMISSLSPFLACPQEWMMAMITTMMIMRALVTIVIMRVTIVIMQAITEMMKRMTAMHGNDEDDDSEDDDSNDGGDEDNNNNDEM